MDISLTFLVIGGDLRQNFLAQHLAEKGCTVYTLGLSGEHPAKGCIAVDSLEQLPYSPDVAVLPLVASNDGVNVNAPFSTDTEIPLKEVCKFLKSSALIVGGKLSGDVQDIFRQSGREFADYFTREELIIENCVPTAEGALQIAIENTPKTIHGSDVLILGFGNVAKATARVFDALGARVHIAARKQRDLAYARTLGYIALPMTSLAKHLGGKDIIINTVPVQLLDSEKLKNVDRDTLIIDLASKPGGVDLAAASDMRLKVIWALSLPGKTAPVTSGIIIADTVLNICRERGLYDV